MWQDGGLGTGTRPASGNALRDGNPLTGRPAQAGSTSPTAVTADANIHVR